MNNLSGSGYKKDGRELELGTWYLQHFLAQMSHYKFFLFSGQDFVTLELDGFFPNFFFLKIILAIPV